MHAIDDHDLVTAHVDCQLVGFATWSDGFVTTLVVAPAFRGRGIAQELYREVARVMGPVSTTSWTGNEAHQHVLAKLGFVHVASIPNDRGLGFDTEFFADSPHAALAV